MNRMLCLRGWQLVLLLFGSNLLTAGLMTTEWPIRALFTTVGLLVLLLTPRG